VARRGIDIGRVGDWRLCGAIMYSIHNLSARAQCLAQLCYMQAWHSSSRFDENFVKIRQIRA